MSWRSETRPWATVSIAKDKALRLISHRLRSLQPSADQFLPRDAVPYRGPISCVPSAEASFSVHEGMSSARNASSCCSCMPADPFRSTSCLRPRPIVYHFNSYVGRDFAVTDAPPIRSTVYPSRSTRAKAHAGLSQVDCRNTDTRLQAICEC